MRAVVIREKEIAIDERPDPVPGAGEVLVRVRAAGLNGADMMQRRGLYPAPAGSPQDIPGMELAGEVDALGPRAERFMVGDRVMAIVGGGAQAELCVVHERQLMPVGSDHHAYVRELKADVKEIKQIVVGHVEAIVELRSISHTH